jgi:glycosyltransferase involved in cell wall biosynthesis
MRKVSVIIPIYNASGYMDKCITSVMNQDFDNFELILVNDGSADNSYDKALEWEAKYPNQIRAFTQENAGQGEEQRCYLC